MAVALINQTRLQHSTQLTFPKYFVYKSDTEETPGPGVAILERKETKVSKIFLSELQKIKPTVNPPAKTVERNIYLFFKVILLRDFDAKLNA
jgi:hypothetical protein